MQLQGGQEESPNQTHRPRTQTADLEQHAVKPKARTHTNNPKTLPPVILFHSPLLILIRWPNPSAGILFGPLTPALITHQTGQPIVI